MHANTSVATGLQSASKAMGALNKVISYRTFVHDTFHIFTFEKIMGLFHTGTNRVSFTCDLHFSE